MRKHLFVISALILGALFIIGIPWFVPPYVELLLSFGLSMSAVSGIVQVSAIINGIFIIIASTIIQHIWGT